MIGHGHDYRDKPDETYWNSRTDHQAVNQVRSKAAISMLEGYCRAGIHTGAEGMLQQSGRTDEDCSRESGGIELAIRRSGIEGGRRGRTTGRASARTRAGAGAGAGAGGASSLSGGASLSSRAAGGGSGDETRGRGGTRGASRGAGGGVLSGRASALCAMIRNRGDDAKEILPSYRLCGRAGRSC